MLILVVKKVSTKVNLIYQMSYQILLLALPFLTSPYISRVIGADGLGIYSYSHSVAKYFEIFALLGIANYGNRLIAQSRDDPKKLNTNFSNLLAVHIILSIIIIITYGLYIQIDSENAYYAKLQWPYIICLVFDISWFYFGIERFKITVTRSFIIKIVTVILIFTLVKNRNDLWKYCLIMSTASLASTSSLWFSLRKLVKIVKPTFSEMKKHILPLLILFIPVIAASVTKYMDKVMIGIISTKTELGYYENAEKVSSMAVSVIGSFGTVLLPRMSYLFSNNDDIKAKEYIGSTLELIMCVSIGICFGLVAIGKYFAVVFWGKAFEKSGLLIQGLAITVPFIAFANIMRTQYLIPKSRDKEFTISIAVGAVVNFFFNLLLIPSMESWGATLATIFAEMVICIIQVLYVRKDLPILSYLKRVFPLLFCGIFMYLIITFVGINSYSWYGLIILVLIGMLIYGILTIAYLLLIKNPIVVSLMVFAKKKFFKRNTRK